jgi:site-specific DNA-methyltransferase (adenine-specific)
MRRAQTFLYRNRSTVSTLVHSDGLDFLRSLPSETASLVFLDPPFNLGKSYSKRSPSLDQKPEIEYKRWMSAVLLESARVLKHGGTIYLYHLPLWAMRFGALLDPLLDFRHWIAISMKNGFVRGRRLYPAHYALLMFTKGKPTSFHVPKWPLEECRHCGEFVKDYGGYLDLVEESGVNLSDVWDDLSPVRHSNRKNRAANELPAILYRRVLEISGSKGELFVEPFAGSGTGVLSAVKSGMRFAACDLLGANFRLIRARLISLKQLKKRSDRRQ